MLALALLAALLPARAADLDAARGAVESHPEDPLAWAAWADALVEAGCATTAEGRFREHLARDPEDPDRWVLLARAEPAEARSLLGEAFRLDPGHALAWATEARWHASRGDHQDARVAAARALRADATSAEAWRTLLTSSRALGLEEEVESAATEARRWVPEEPAVWLALGDPESLEAGLGHLPDHPDLLVALAGHRLREGDPDGAAELLERAGPDARGLGRVAPLVDCARSGALDDRGLAILDEASTLAFSDPASARELLDAESGAWATCPAGWTTRAGIRRALADARGAHADLERALELAPDDPWLQETAALSHLERGERHRALELLDRARVARPGDVEIALARATLLVDPDQADSALELLAEQHPLDPDIALARAGHLASLGAPDEALDALLDTLAGGACQDELHAASLALARPLGRVADVQILWAAPPPRPLPTEPDPEVDEEVVVRARSEVERLRAALETRLVDIGYREGRDKGDRLVFRPDRPIMPVVTLHEDGALDVQLAGYVTMSDGSKRTISERKMAPRRARVLDAIWPDLLALREAIAMAATAERVWAALPDLLDSLWHDGVPLSGSERLLDTPAARRGALLDHWASRTCTPAGDAVRAGIERYLTLEVQPSQAPVTQGELDAANAASGCERVLVLDVEP